MKLPRSLAALVGPTTRASELKYVGDLTQAFRASLKEQAKAAPSGQLINNHLRSVLQPRVQSSEADTYDGMSCEHAASQAYIAGELDTTLLHRLIGRAQSKQALVAVKHFALKSHIDLEERTDLSARYTARLLHLGYLDEARILFRRHGRAWRAMDETADLLITYVSRIHGIEAARALVEDSIEDVIPAKKRAFVRSLLRESVRARSPTNVEYCMEIDSTACQGQESGLAKWLLQHSLLELSYSVLLAIITPKARDIQTGIQLARKFAQEGKRDRAYAVSSWCKRQFILSTQADLRALEKELSCEAHEQRRCSTIYDTTCSAYNVT